MNLADDQPTGKKADSLVEYRVSQLELRDEKKELRLQALELWRAKVEDKVRDLKSGDDTNSKYAPTANQWVKIILTILAALSALVYYVTQKGGI